MKFQQAIKKLNRDQLQAVEATEGPVMVIAGPGTGKTQVLTLRIANILKKTDTDPQSILGLTFTESASHSMRKRLLKFIGTTAFKVNISTFHAFASGLIKEYPDYFNNLSSGDTLDDIARIKIVESILDKNQFNLLKPTNTPYYYLSAILSSISILKRESVFPKDFKILLKQNLKSLEDKKEDLTKAEFIKQESQILKNLELLTIYQKYQEVLTLINRYDYEDMINWVKEALLQNEDFREIVQERFQYVLVDEYQDTNNSQNQIVNLLSSFWGESANIFVVLDDEQAIFRFQGASLENALNFTKSYPKAKIITLTDNYRSQQNILDSSRSVIENNKYNLQNKLTQINRKLISKTDFPVKKIKIAKTNTQIEENLFLVNKIKFLLTKEVNSAEIAIIVRNNNDLTSISQALTHSNIPHFVEGGDNVLDSLVVKYLILLLTVLNTIRVNQEDPELFTLLNYPFTKINPLSVIKLSRLAHKNKTTILDLALKKNTKIKRYLNKLINISQKESQTTFVKFLELALKKSGLLNWILSQDEKTFLSDINSFFEFAKILNQSQKDLNLNLFLDNLKTLKANNLKIPSSTNQNSHKKVTLITAHKAKGQEWDYCFIAGCIDGKWGNQVVRSLIKLPTEILKNNLDHDPLEDERRLFYVALTRTRKKVYISFAKSYPTQGKLKYSFPSQFIDEITKKNKVSVKVNFSSKSISSFTSNIISPPQNDLIVGESDFIDGILKEFRFSVTALNNYLECPYKFKLNNLYRIPTSKKAYLSFGTAVHTALENFHKKYKQEKILPKKEFLLKKFKTALKKEILTPEELSERITQGKKILEKYFDLHKNEFKQAFFIEKFFGSANSPVLLEDIFLTGKIDRIDIIDEAKKTIKVIDYKTGKKKTRGQIEGTTADQNGSLKRQLVFYKLLASLDPHFPYQVEHAELDFIQSPSEANKSGKEVFIISNKEVEELKSVIKNSYQRIKEHQFEKTSDNSICQNCEFKNHCWPKGQTLT